ncbi:hypothetical protein Nepgr_019750 [Nepenthes gracilis]|uniref:Uncharacterized protein n=1 Tax=Nepenthes gracilis TaxID=150966 RepID=A0AAD3XVC6_NEPGR|nr:hypothetical protein Nepgr_019750 [Nepenthes gracilis]
MHPKRGKEFRNRWFCHSVSHSALFLGKGNLSEERVSKRLERSLLSHIEISTFHSHRKEEYNDLQTSA